MRKQSQIWKVRDLIRRYPSINFPEYQREPNVWQRAAKMRLIDSMMRDFDIASIYLYRHDARQLDCIDGRQRLGAIMSFLGCNEEDQEDNAFEYKVLNEVFTDTDVPFGALEGMTFQEMEQCAQDTADQKRDAAVKFRDALLDYEIAVVELSGSREPAEFNLQFTRLNLGTIINSGEKLHAMVGDLRDECFGPNGVGKHKFLDQTTIPTRRFAKEQVAAQVLGQVFSLKQGRGYSRMRYFDMQRLLKEYQTLTVEQREWIAEVRTVMDLLEPAFTGTTALRNRAMTVSIILLALEQAVTTQEQAVELAKFVSEFHCRLQWQVGLGPDINSSYRYLLDFQRHVTQASVEKPAVEGRAAILGQAWQEWKRTREIIGDHEFRDQHRRDPATACREAS